MLVIVGIAPPSGARNIELSKGTLTERHSPSEVVGCWKQHLVAPAGPHVSIPTHEICLARDGTGSGLYMGANGYGGDEDDAWNLTVSGAIHIAGETCGLKMRDVGKVMRLFHCHAAGEYIVKCRTFDVKTSACESKVWMHRARVRRPRTAAVSAE